MSTSSQGIERTPPATSLEQKPSTYNCSGYILVAVGLITLIGSLVLAGYIYSEPGYTSYAIGAAGIACSILSCVLARYYCIKTAEPLPPPVEEEVKPTPPLFPNLFNLQMSGPLSSPLREESFLRQETYGGYPLADAKGAPLLKPDNKLLDIPLEFWFTRDPNALNAKRYLNALNDPEREKQIKMINERIEELDRSVNLKERLKVVGYSNITVKELLPAWGNSYLRFKLMLDDELNTLTVESIRDLDHAKVDEAIGGRIFRLAANSRRELPTTFNQTTINKMLLIDLPKLKAEHIHKAPHAFVPITFLLLTKEEFSKIDLTKLSTDQLHFIFSKEHYLEDVSPERINACIPLIQDKKLFKNLDETQIIGFDYSLIDQAIFDAIFVGRDELYKLFPKLGLQSIYRLIPFLSDDNWEEIGDAHALVFDFSQIPDRAKRRHVFDRIYDKLGLPGSSTAAKLFSQVTIERLYELIPLFSRDHWNHIGDSHATTIDFSKIPEGQRQSAAKRLYAGDTGPFSNAAKFLPRLSATQIASVRPYLNDKALAFIKV